MKAMIQHGTQEAQSPFSIANRVLIVQGLSHPFPVYQGMRSPVQNARHDFSQRS
jgi:hypothetical protein